MNDTAPETTSTPGFAALGVAPKLLAALTALGYEEPTPIQREAIPPLLEGRDLLGQAGTGTGKTAAFALPLLQRLAVEQAEPNKPRGLVLVPTRELAMQVAEAIHRYGKELHASVLPIYGGQSFHQQLRALSRGVQIVVATPGRALDHLVRGTIDLSQVRTVVLDEADEMLDMGFAEDLEAILGRTPKERQTALFSATLAARILAIAEAHLRDPIRIAIGRERAAHGAIPRVRQVAYTVQRAFKQQALGRVLDMEQPTSAIIFCRTRIEVDELTEAMNAHGFRSEALHGGFMQDHRDRVMKRFRANQADLLIATDVAARGLDIDHVSHVVNFDVPTDPDTYVHRIGRTGRAGREGVAITFTEPREHRLLRGIERATQQKITMATLPTIAELRHRRLELTRATVLEAVLAGGLDAYRAVVSDLSSEHDPLDVAAAALKLVHEASHAEASARAEEQDIPTESQRDMGRGQGPNQGRPQFRRPFEQEARGPMRDGPGRDGPGRDGPGRDGPGRRRDPGMVRVFIGAGRIDGVRPGDLVGAITNEAGIESTSIGAIEINDRFALVDLSEEHADDVIRALRATKIRGRKAIVRRDRDGGN